MFEARLKSSAVLKKLFDAIKDLLDSAIFNCSDLGIQMDSLDRSLVAAVSLLLRSDGFSRFQCDENVALGLRIETMSKILKIIKNDDALTMQAEDNAKKVIFVIESPNREMNSIFDMTLMNLDQERPNLPAIDILCSICLPSAEFASNCRHLSQFGDTMVIAFTDEGVKFSVRGEFTIAEVKSVQTMPVDNEKEAIIIEMEKPISITYACRYLNSFTKATPFSTRVQLSILADENATLLVEYRAEEYGHIRNYLPSMNV